MGRLTSGSDNIGPDFIRHEVGRHSLHQQRRRRFALAVRVASRYPPVEAGDAARGDHLARLPHVPRPVPRVEEFEEGDGAEEDGGGVDGERLGVLVERLVPESRLVVLQRRLRGDGAGLGAPDPAVGDQDVDVADVLLDVRDDGLESVFRGNVSD